MSRGMIAVKDDHDPRTRRNETPDLLNGLLRYRVALNEFNSVRQSMSFDGLSIVLANLDVYANDLS